MLQATDHSKTQQGFLLWPVRPAASAEEVLRHREEKQSWRLPFGRKEREKRNALLPL